MSSVARRVWRSRSAHRARRFWWALTARPLRSTTRAWVDEYLLPGEQGQQGALGGGGRYDGLVELLGGTSTPAIGFAIGIDRVVLALEARGLLPAVTNGPAIVVAGIEPESVAERVAIASQLRTAGASARADVSMRKIGKQLEAAVRDGASAVIIVEPDGRLSIPDGMRKRDVSSILYIEDFRFSITYFPDTKVWPEFKIEVKE